MTLLRQYYDFNQEQRARSAEGAEYPVWRISMRAFVYLIMNKGNVIINCIIGFFKPLILIIINLHVTPSSAQNILIFEDYETGDFENKGWYDGFSDQRTTNEYKNGTH